MGLGECVKEGSGSGFAVREAAAWMYFLIAPLREYP